MSTPFHADTMDEVNELFLDVYRRLNQTEGNRSGIVGNVSVTDSKVESDTTSISSTDSKSSSRAVSQSILISGNTSRATSNSVNISTTDSKATSHATRTDDPHDTLAWTKISAATVTLAVGGSASTVLDLRTHADGNFYHIDEVAGAPGINLIVDFTGVIAFRWVNILACYTGSSTHALAIQLYNWSTTAWDTFDSLQNAYCDVTTASGYILGNHDYFVGDDTNYIGTGGDKAKVRVRFYHTMAGNAAHDVEIDVAALYYRAAHGR